MTLKFKRYYPIMMILVGLLLFLAIVLGDYPIIAYGI